MGRNGSFLKGKCEQGRRRMVWKDKRIEKLMRTELCKVAMNKEGGRGHSPGCQVTVGV